MTTVFSLFRSSIVSAMVFSAKASSPTRRDMKLAMKAAAKVAAFGSLASSSLDR